MAQDILAQLRSVKCPFCGAEPGEKCHRMDGATDEDGDPLDLGTPLDPIQFPTFNGIHYSREVAFRNHAAQVNRDKIHQSFMATRAAKWRKGEVHR
jgi:hypothetical protein